LLQAFSCLSHASRLEFSNFIPLVYMFVCVSTMLLLLLWFCRIFFYLLKLLRLNEVNIYEVFIFVQCWG
jgi:hypothetical protein